MLSLFSVLHLSSVFCLLMATLPIVLDDIQLVYISVAECFVL